MGFSAFYIHYSLNIGRAMSFKNFVAILLAGLLFAGVVGCKEKGPAEKAGEEIDKAVEKAGDKVNELLGN